MKHRPVKDPALDEFISGPLALECPRARSARTLLSKEGRDSGGLLSNERTASDHKELTFLLECRDVLFDYQREIVEELNANDGRGLQRAMVALPTGGGKTRTALWFCRERIVAKRAERVLWLAPTIELVNQAVDSLKQLWDLRENPPIEVRLHGVDNFIRLNSASAMFCFVTTQLATSRAEGVKNYKPDLVIIDEAHQAASRTVRDLIATLSHQNSTTLVGLSATPGRASGSEGELLSDIFGGNLVIPRRLMPDPVKNLRARGVLCRIHRREIALPRQWENARIKKESSKQISDQKLALIPARFWAVVDTIESIARDRQCIVFCSSIAHCKALAAALEFSGISRRVLSSKTPARERSETIGDFKNGRLMVLLNKSILATGFDLPQLSDAVFATPVRSPILWEQIVGRVSRGPRVGGSADANLWELDDHFALHEDVLSARRYTGDIW